MSFSRIIPHRAAGYIEVVFDGHEDWLSAVDTIELIVAAVEQLDVQRVLLDFRLVDMRIAVSEAPHVAEFFHKFAYQKMSIGIIQAGDLRACATINAFANNMLAQGHEVVCLEAAADVVAWIGTPATGLRRAS
ncbi:hypothetical protein [Maricaulis salignorans]|uniref:SpoIIAA-like n=1 Tax=Maricaulis salignorans TaxID=144026 RepID=A0A1G9SF82_9PROT|nr:hypothetical protein [Maricaulis salignorans]SDM33445.1 hypothetical protein SAMN04488568_10963 [Maricaulis salignorans]